ncbi:hypothetical protein [Blastopirellula retiformator]|uniref:Secreted protein n=1 Tax=Blastopirellula retiformator TaxID=2527970 RepID=A0A5C5V276_9BACT|nr:hypothetical protein [Blastopirellula retiformator]TWT32578.1 hypothetical protein Enr8_23820 [Blastopirellula retiformator]
MPRLQTALWIGACFSVLFFTRSSVAEPPTAEESLVSYDLASGKAALEDYLAENEGDASQRFGLGVVQFASAVETMSQSFYECGVRDHRQQIPFLRIVAAENPNPKATSYQDVRNILQRFVDDLAVAEQTLAKVDDKEVKLPLPLFQIRLDLNGDGTTTEAETLAGVAMHLRMIENVPGNAGVDRPYETVVAFDYADCLWLRGYCHLLSGLAETWLAYDMQQLHDRAGYVLFEKIDSPHAYLGEAKKTFPISGVDIIDVVALIHLINFPVKEPAKLKDAHAHFLQVISLSRRTWDTIEAETDDDREWIPSPKQSSPVSRVRTTPEMVTTWREFLDELEAILQGEKLAPHPRIVDGRGINVKKVFFEPQPFDLVMWVQGSGATPFLEKGPITDQAFWSRINRAFNGQFMSFAVWYN